MATQADVEALRALEQTRTLQSTTFGLSNYYTEGEYLRMRRHLVAVLRSHGMDVGIAQKVGPVTNIMHITPDGTRVVLSREDLDKGVSVEFPNGEWIEIYLLPGIDDVVVDCDTAGGSYVEEDAMVIIPKGGRSE